MPSREEILKRLASVLRTGQPHPTRRLRNAAPSLDRLEDRVVLSHFSHHAHHLAERLAAAQVSSTSTATTTASTTSVALDSSSSTDAGTSTNTTTGSCAGGPGGATQDAQLTTDLQQLQSDVQAAIGGSAVTDAQRQALGNDFRALANAGVTVDRTALAAASDTILNDLASGNYTANATADQAAFTAAFSGASGAALTSDQTALVDTAYNDFVTVATNLNLDSSELSALTNDQSLIQADLTRLGFTTTGDHGPGLFSTLDLVLGGPQGSRGPGIGGRGFGGHGRRF